MSSSCFLENICLLLKDKVSVSVKKKFFFLKTMSFLKSKCPSIKQQMVVSWKILSFLKSKILKISVPRTGVSVLSSKLLFIGKNYLLPKLMCQANKQGFVGKHCLFLKFSVSKKKQLFFGKCWFS